MPTPDQLDVHDRILPNGLKILLREDHSAPLVSMWTWYRVGSRNELPGLTGVSHWVEHMQFKGTPSLAKGQVFRDVSRHGGILNAMTSYDWTAYYETLPAADIDLAITIESDRMVNSLYDPVETASERTVILSERQGAENRPTYLLYEEMLGASFRAHPYGHAVIGHESDLKAMTRDDLYGHYQTFYNPGNAFVVMVGDFDAGEMFGRVERAFGPISAGSPPPPVRAVEPAQLGERRVRLERPAPTSYLQVAYHAPAAGDPDVPALLMTDAVLSGGKGLGMGGSGGLGRASRLYKALVSTGLARGASSDFDLYLDPYLMSVAVTALPETEPARIEEVVNQEIGRLATEPVTELELARAKKQMSALYTYASEGVTNQAFRLGQMEIVDSYDRAASLLAEISRVTPDDVLRVAAKYLRQENRTVGWLIPTRSGSGAGETTEVIAAASDLPNFSDWGLGGPTLAPTSSESAYQRAELANGMTLLGQVRPQSPSVALRIRLEGGAVRDPEGQTGLASFTARMMQRGTERHSFDKLNDLTDSIGANLSVDSSRHHTEISIRTLVEDLPAMIELAAEVIRTPVFPVDELEKVRNQILSGIKEADNDTGSRASRAFRQLVFPAPHPYGRRVAGELDTVEGISRADLASFHQTQLGPTDGMVAVVGGVGSFDQVAELLNGHLGTWINATERQPQVEFPAPPVARQETAVEIPGKSQVDIVLGLPTVERTHPAYYALDTANLILGRLGLMGRLGATVRDRDGMAYYASSSIDAGRDGSLWTSRAGVDPHNVERAIDGILTQLRLIRDEEVSEEELADAKSYLIGVLPIALESNAGVAATLINLEYYGLGLDFIERYPGIIGALTREDLLSAMRTWLNPDFVSIGIAGPPAS